MSNWAKRQEADSRARKVWTATTATIRDEWLEANKSAQTTWVRTSEAIRANRELSYKARENDLSRAFRAYQDKKDYNWQSFQIGKDRAWATFQAKLAHNAAEFAKAEQADRDARNRAKQDNSRERDEQGRFTAKPTNPANRAFWDNGDRSRAKYLELCKRYHPDFGGDTRTMQDINAAFGR